MYIDNRIIVNHNTCMNNATIQQRLSDQCLEEYLSDITDMPGNPMEGYDASTLFPAFRSMIDQAICSAYQRGTLESEPCAPATYNNLGHVRTELWLTGRNAQLGEYIEPSTLRLPVYTIAREAERFLNDVQKAAL